MFDAEKAREDVLKLLDLHKNGYLGSGRMPEDENPCLDIRSKENYLYFTLPMALNYQRDSYKLWKSANQTYRDEATVGCFSPRSAVQMPVSALTECLMKYKVALQPNKQPAIWRTLCNTIHERFDGDIRKLFVQEKHSVANVKAFMMKHKPEFPYLSGKKIMNYWLYVLEQYTGIRFEDRENITVAPDTHIVQASCRLGVVSENELGRQDLQDVVAERWREILAGTGYCPIDIHTPLWLWSRGKFQMGI